MMTLLEFIELESCEKNRSSELAKVFMSEIRRCAQSVKLSEEEIAIRMWPPSFSNTQKFRLFLADPNPDFETVFFFCRATGDLVHRILDSALDQLAGDEHCRPE